MDNLGGAELPKPSMLSVAGLRLGDVEDFRWGLEQVRTGRIKPTPDRALPLSRASEAHRLISTNRVMGNIVLLPWAE